MKPVTTTICLLLAITTMAQFKQREKEPLKLAATVGGAIVHNRPYMHQYIGVGVWTKKGGLFVTCRQFTEDAADVFTSEVRTIPVLNYYGRVLIKDVVLASPFVGLGNSYFEIGMQLHYRVQPQLMMGLTTAATNKNPYYGLAAIVQF